MNEENKPNGVPLKSGLLQGDFPELRSIGEMANALGARKEIAKLPYGSDDPKTVEIAKKYGLKCVPSF